VAHRTPGQLANRRRVERVISFAAPALDLLLFAGERVSRVAGRNDVDPEPPRIGRRSSRTPIGGPTGVPERRG
jgi:type IV secretory pathway ATPase VirB11/archaellum biosynthesis ATPase